jgi:hypothetical protein
LFLDDLPSATVLPGSDVLYAENIPIGYIAQEDFANTYSFEDGTPLLEVAIFNHLDFRVFVHPNLFT